MINKDHKNNKDLRFWRL